jgi:hypothetical protein
MGQIVEFSGPRRDRAPQSRAMIEGPAQILFFTGVRYTRESDMPPVTSRAQKGRRRGWFKFPRGKKTKPS